MGFILRMESTSALAELEVKEKQASTLGSADYQTFKDQQVQEAITEKVEMGESTGTTTSSSSESDTSSDSTDSDSSSDGTESNDSGDGDSSDVDIDDIPDIPDEDEEPEEEESEEEKEKDEEEKLKQESFRDLSFIPPEDQTIRMESFGAFMGTVGSSVWNGLSFVMTTLAQVGIKYTPLLLNGMFKVVLFTFAKTFKLLDEFYGLMETTVVRFLNRTTKQKKSIQELRDRTKQLLEQGALVPEGVSKQIDVRHLLLGDSLNLDKNVATLVSFADQKIASLHKSLLHDFSDLEMIARNRYLGKSFNAMSFMKIDPSKSGFTQIYGDASTPEISFTEYGMGVMTGNVEICAKLNAEGHDTWNNIEKAYSGSRIYLKPRSTKYLEEVPLMSPGELVGFLNNLELLAEVSLKHQIFYDEIKRSRSGMVTSVKQLFVRLFEEKVKVSFKDSVTLPLYLKSSFATKVYLTGALDIHDHIAQVIANGLSYSSEMLKLYKVKS